MKSKATFAINILAALLLLASITNVLAQGPEPPHPPRPPVRRNPPRQPFSGWSWSEEGEPLPHSSQKIDSTTQIESPAVALGQPGLSFRYVQTFGETEEPYPADAEHLYYPDGIFIDSGDNLYMVEEMGHRMLKFNAAGTNQLVIGHAGQPWHHDDYLSYPKDVAVDSGGNIWVVIDPAVKQFDSSGNLLQVFPETEPWVGGDANDRFDGPRGIAFDSSGRLYVSDTWNHRIQVYDLASGSPVYSGTIGETGVSGSDNAHFNEPAKIAFDSSDRLYVMDTANHRVQRCEYTTSWSCSTFFGVTGVPGSDLNHVEWAFGITIDTSDDIYLADGANYRVLKCNTTGSCSHFVGITGEWGSDEDHFYWPADVAVDSSDNVYVSDWDNHRVQKFDSSGTYIGTVGVTQVPYLVDTTRLNGPWGIALAADGSLYVAESRGYRLVKLDSDGNQLWAVGEPGIYGSDDDHFGDWWTGPEGNLGIDSSGRVYVPDTPNNRIQIFNSSGTLVGTLGTYGSGNYQFDCPTGIAISPINDDIYVADRCNHRVQVFNSNKIYKDTLGVTGVTDSGNSHFNLPYGVAVDTSGNVYVVDTDNHRIQIFDSSHTYQRTIGVTGESGDDFGHFYYPHAVAVDGEGRVYVASGWSNVRIQVFDDTGAYLTTIGGQWGSNTGEMRFPAGVAVDDEGNVYVTEVENHRIQKFSPGIPGWIQVNVNGFGNRDNTIPALATFNKELYAGSWNGAEIWRSSDGQIWTEFTPPWSTSDNGVSDLTIYESQLYAGTWNDDIGAIWRTDGDTWEQVVSNGFGDDNNYEINNLATYDGSIYAAASNDVTGTEIWSSSSGNPGSWTQVNSDGFGSAGIWHDVVMDTFAGYLHIGFGRNDIAELWRWDGASWTPIFQNGLGNPYNTNVSSFAEFQGYLYMGLRNVEDGGQVRRSTDGTSWSPVITGGLGNVDNGRPYGLIPFEDNLYLIFSNTETGAEIWRSHDGTQWALVMEKGWGDSKNTYADYFDKGAAVFNGSLYIGTLNSGNGSQIWQMLHQIYLPLIQR